MRVVNPVVRRLVEAGRAGDELMVLHFTGRRTGRSYDVPVGVRVVDGSLCVFTSSPWRHNVRSGGVVQVSRRGRRETLPVELVDDPHEVTTILARLIEAHGPAWARRALGIRIHVPRNPTTAELQAMVEECGFSVLRLGTDVQD